MTDLLARGGEYKKRAMLHLTKTPTRLVFSRILQIYIVH